MPAVTKLKWRGVRDQKEYLWFNVMLQVSKPGVRAVGKEAARVVGRDTEEKAIGGVRKSKGLE